MKISFLIILVFVAGLGFVGLVGVYRAQNAIEKRIITIVKPEAVRCATLSLKPYTITETFYGLIEARARVDMAFQIVGRISVLGEHEDKPLAENNLVRKGDVIAKLEPLRYEASVRQAKASIEDAKAALATAMAGIAEVDAVLADAKSELQSVQKIRQRNATTDREVERSELAVKRARARLDGARATLASGEAAYQSARAASMRANIDLQDTILRAPMNSTVAAIPAEIGQMASPGQPVITLVDLSRVKLIVGVVERKIPLLREGQKVSIEVLALSSQAGIISDSQTVGRAREGIVKVVPPAANSSTGLFNVEIEMKNEDGMLYPGMIGKATVAVMQQNVVAIPASVAVRRGDKAWAYFVGDGYTTGLQLGLVGSMKIEVPTTVARRVGFNPVTVDRNYYLVTELPQGMNRLVVEGHTRLSDGQTVRVIDPLVRTPVRLAIRI